MKIKPLQAAVLIVGCLCTVGVGVWLSMGSGDVKLPHVVTLVDVTSGQIFEVSTARRAISEPAANPDTGKVALLRVSKNEQGKWVVSGRAMPLLEDLDFEAKAIDPETGEVLTPSPDVRRFQPK